MAEKQYNIETNIHAIQGYLTLVFSEIVSYKLLVKGFVFRYVSNCTYCNLLHYSCILCHNNCILQHYRKIADRFYLVWSRLEISLMNCRYCEAECIKKGVYKTTQRYYCKACNKYQQAVYIYGRCTEDDTRNIIRYMNEGNSISSISRLIGLSKATVIRKIKEIAAKIVFPVINEEGKEYEIDEMQTFVGKNEPSNYRYIIYAINKSTKRVIDFSIGRRTKENLQKVINNVLKLTPVRIYTDGLSTYKTLIEPSIHKVRFSCTNHIERNNLTLRTHIKRLSRKTICFSRSIEMLQNCVAIYFRYGYL